MDKKQIRHQMKKQRAKLSQKTVLEYSSAIWDKIYQKSLYKNAHTVFLYSSIGNEVDTAILASQALKDGKEIAYPVTNTKNMTMEFYKIDSLSQLYQVKSGSFKLYEPKTDPAKKAIPDANSLMIVPGLAFDNKLYRTGYGGGFYDKYLAKYQGLATIGVCYDFQKVDSLPTDKYDQAVSILITPSNIYIKEPY